MKKLKKYGKKKDAKKMNITKKEIREFINQIWKNEKLRHVCAIRDNEDEKWNLTCEYRGMSQEVLYNEKFEQYIDLTTYFEEEYTKKVAIDCIYDCLND